MKRNNINRKPVTNALLVSAYKIWAEFTKRGTRQHNAAYCHMVDNCRSVGKSVDAVRDMYDASLNGVSIQ